MNKPSILFVDDEPNILAGIRRMLRSMRKDIDFFFAEDGYKALDILRQEEIHIICSDMRMPGMDGADLLIQVQEKYPHIIRIMLTGQANEESVMRTVGVVHQFLSKPCEPEYLKTIMLRSIALYNVLTNMDLKGVISKISVLPSLPSVYANLQKTLQNPDATANDVASIIEQDIAMTAKLLQLVNSSFFGLFQKVENPSRAVKLLGLETIKTLVLGMEIFNTTAIESHYLPLTNLWQHSMSVAHCCKKITQSLTNSQDLINHSFLAGMLHDIGKLLLLSRFTTKYDTVLEYAISCPCSPLQAELHHFNATHGDIGSYLIGLWGFHGDIVEAVAFHNNLSAYPCRLFSLALTVHLADYYYYCSYPEEVIGSAPVLDQEYIGKLDIGLDLHACQTLAEACYNEANRQPS